MTFEESVLEAAPVRASPIRPARTRSAAPARPTARGLLEDPLRLLGAVTLGIATVVSLLWLLGSALASGGPTELQRFNAGRPVMLCTAGRYQAVDDTLLGRVFGERYFSCRDWKMGE